MTGTKTDWTSCPGKSDRNIFVQWFKLFLGNLEFTEQTVCFKMFLFGNVCGNYVYFAQVGLRYEQSEQRHPAAAIPLFDACFSDKRNSMIFLHFSPGRGSDVIYTNPWPFTHTEWFPRKGQQRRTMKNIRKQRYNTITCLWMIAGRESKEEDMDEKVKGRKGERDTER